MRLDLAAEAAWTSAWLSDDVLVRRLDDWVRDTLRAFLDKGEPTSLEQLVDDMRGALHDGKTPRYFVATCMGAVIGELIWAARTGQTYSNLDSLAKTRRQGIDTRSLVG